MAVKLDMSKVYNRVEWFFLEVMMKKLGFGLKWIDIVMMCMYTIKYAILVNGQVISLQVEGLDRRIPYFPIYFSYVQRV